jgi:hypothetical protein
MKMFKIGKLAVTIVGLLAGVISAKADVLLGWDVAAYPSAPIPSSAPSVVNHTSIQAASLTRGVGLTASGGTNGFASSGWTTPSSSTAADAVTSNDYFTFTATAQAGETFDVTNFSWRGTRSGTGPSNFVLRSSVDSFGADIAVFGTTGTGDRAFSASLNLTGQTNVEFRIYGYTAPQATGTARLTDGSSFGQAGLDMTLFGTATGGFVPTNVQFAGSSASASESLGTYTVTVYKTLADGNVSGEVALSGTATEGGGADYTVNTTNFTMNGSTTSATFVVTINDDAVVESGETVVLTLANVVGGTVASPSVFTLTITDNDVAPEVPEGIAAFRFSSGPHLQVSTVDANITVSDVSLSAGTIETNVTTGAYFPNEPYVEETAGWTASSQGSAKAYQFTITPDVGYSVTITGISFRAYASGAGPSAVGYTVGGVASYATDVADSVLVVVSQAVTGVDNQTSPVLVQIQGWTNGTRSTSGGGILKLDDVVVFGVIGTSTPTTNVQFTASSASVDEAGGTYTVTVYKTLADGNVSGEVALSGTATEGGGADYTVNTTNFTMNGSTTSATFVVTINDDAVVESGETVVLTLANVVGGTVASPSVFTLTITDNDVAPEVPEGIAAFRFSSGPHLQVSTVDANITVSDVSLSAGTIETNVTTGAYFPNEPYVEETAGWTASSQGSAKAYQFTITPDVGYSVTITGISFRAYASGAGPSAVGYTVGGVASYATDVADSVLVVVSQAVTGVDNQTSPILVQIQGWTNGTRSTSGGGILKLDDVVVFGTITSGSGYSQEQEDYIVGYWGSVGAYTGDDLDDDGDGFNNVEEFVAQTIPVLPNGATSFFYAVNYNVLNRQVGYVSATGRLYRMWGRQNLMAPPDWVPVAGTLGNGGLQTLQESASTSSFLRLTVEMAP